MIRRETREERKPFSCTHTLDRREPAMDHPSLRFIIFLRL